MAVAFAAVMSGGCVRHAPPAPTIEAEWVEALTAARAAAARGDYEAADGALDGFSTRRSGAPEARETLFWRGLLRAQAARSPEDLRLAAGYFDRYLDDTARAPHETEARVLSRLLRLTDSLSVVGDSANASARQGASRFAAREEELKKEIQSLREQLDRTNEELARIRRRLGTEKP